MHKNKNEIAALYKDKLQSEYNVCVEDSNDDEKYNALVLLMQDLISYDWISTEKRYNEENFKRVYYFSLEFLPGKLIEQYLIYLDLKDTMYEAFNDLGINLDNIIEIEKDPALGNGGLGRLAACYMDSMASLSLPGLGFGIRYKYGLFRQKIVDGYQNEIPENWLKEGKYLEKRRDRYSVKVRFGGTVDVSSENCRLIFKHKNYEEVLAVPYDVPVVGYKNNIVNTLRLYSAEPVEGDFDFAAFSEGNHEKAMSKVNSANNISYVLYPDDNNNANKLLRLKQQYFLVSSGVQNIIASCKKSGIDLRKLNEKVGIHINDTHPTLAICELMRILMDEEGFEWDEAWDITVKTISFTNHTILPEALEKWPVDLIKTLLPRIFMILEEIDRRLYNSIWEKYGKQKAINMAIINNGVVRMANLAITGSHSINGVAELHTKILKNEVMKDFCDVYPERFNNKTNGITHRRFLLKANPKLSNLITETIGDGWICHPNELEKLETFINDESFIDRFSNVKAQNKREFVKYVQNTTGIVLNENSIFDCQIKRMHEYKRQLLNVLHIMYLYNQILENHNADITPRTFIFSGKAANGYYAAKQIIKLINTVGEQVNNDPLVNGRIKVVFMEDYRVSLAEKIIPSADVSEQISTASKEASGTGNMKLMMNGAITIGTLDGANIEILDKVTMENMFIFGMKSDEVMSLYKNGGYVSREIYEKDSEIRLLVDRLVNGFFHVKKDEFRTIYDSLLCGNDEYFILKDFRSYVNAQKELENAYNDKKRWIKMSLINTSRSGIFSSDRSIMEYAKDIWNIYPLK